MLRTAFVLMAMLWLQGCMCCSVLAPPRKATPASACLETTTTESCQVEPLTDSLNGKLRF